MPTFDLEKGLLTDKQTEVLDLVLLHKSSKDIARTLGISPYTVDQRITAARRKFRVDSRAELARAYMQYRDVCGPTAYEFSHLAETAQDEHQPGQALPEEPVLELADAIPLRWNAMWQDQSFLLAGLEELDRRAGPAGRLSIVGMLALALAIAALVMASLAETLSRLF